MRRYLLASMLAVLPLAVSAQTPLPSGPHVVAPGEGEVIAVPDMVEIEVSVRVLAANPGLAKRNADVAVDRFLQVLHKHKIAERDVRASSLSLSEEFDYDNRDRRVSQGHVATRDVTVTLHGTDTFNDILDEALAAGMTRIDNIRFKSEKETELRIEARRKAAEDSRRRAIELAQAYGTQLGPVYSINSVNSGLADRYGGATSLDRVQVTGSRTGNAPRYLQPQIEFKERVQTVFELQP